MTGVLEAFKASYDQSASKPIGLTEFLELCSRDKMAYATTAERMLAAIGDPVLVETARDQRLSRLFGNRIIKTYPAFGDFFGMEETLERLVDYFAHAAQGLEEANQMLYLLGPVGGGKSSLVERLKELMETHPIYVLATELDGKLIHSPYFANPLSLFAKPGLREQAAKLYNIPIQYINGVIGPWESKRIREFNGDLSKFKVVRLFPSKLNQIAISQTEPGDENTQDVSTLVGKVDIRKLEEYSQNDADAYLWSGGLNQTHRGVLDFREMFKAKIKMLNPLLFAVQEHAYQGSENLSAIPYDGIVLAHSNEAEWDKFRTNKDNEAFLDRIYIVKVPYCLRRTEEMSIYRKRLSVSTVAKAPIAPGTLEMAAEFAVLSRLIAPEDHAVFSKMQVYDGENLKERDPRAKTYQEYHDLTTNRQEGMSGISTRWMFKRLSQVFNTNAAEIGANPVHLMRVLLDEIVRAEFAPEREKELKNFVVETLRPKYLELLDKEVRAAFLESYGDYGQNQFDKYVLYADHWSSDEHFYDANTGTTLDREALNLELEKIEKPAGIANPKDFRNEVVKFVLRHAQKNSGKNPDWQSYEKLRIVIEKKIFAQTDDLLPIISFDKKSTEDHEKKHKGFVERMIARGYTERQVRILIDWYMRVKKAV